MSPKRQFRPGRSEPGGVVAEAKGTHVLERRTTRTTWALARFVSVGRDPARGGLDVTRNQTFEKRVRVRMPKTGERYAAARRHRVDALAGHEREALETLRAVGFGTESDAASR